MHYKVRLIQIGNSVGITLPRETLAALNVGKGDELTLTRSPTGFNISPFDTAQLEQLEAARAIMKRRRHALHELAK